MKKKNIKNICIGYPPYDKSKSLTLLSRNREFQYFKEFRYQYPLISSSAATILKNEGYNVYFLDSLIREITTTEWFDILDDMKPELIFFEVKTHLIYYMWEVVDSLKNRYPDIIIVLGGRHVTAFPVESMEHSKVDYILRGCDFDFLLLNLIEYLNGKKKLNQGIYYRSKNGNIKTKGDFEAITTLDNIPFIDRGLTEWTRYSYNNNTSFRKYPITYIMSGRDHWFHNSEFHLSNMLHRNFRVRDTIDVLDEIEFLVQRYNVKEIVDNTLCFPVGEWLSIFCQEMIERKLNKKVRLSCNMNFGLLKKEEYKLMKRAGFNILFFSLEPHNQNILDEANGISNINTVLSSCKHAKKAGLSPHVTVMIGNALDTETDLLNTFSLIKNLLYKGYIDSVYANIVIPYPGTELFATCKSNDLLVTENWSMYDMRQTIIKTKLSESSIRDYIRYFYNLRFNPIFLIRKLFSIRNVYDIKYFIRTLKTVFFDNIEGFD